MQLPRDVLLSLEIINPNGTVGLSRFDDQTLREALQTYRQIRIAELNRTLKEQPCRSLDGISVLRSSISARQGVSQLLPMACVYSHILSNDPLASLIRPSTPTTEAYNDAFGGGDELDREKIGNAIRDLIDLSPLVEEGVLSVAPLAAVHDSPNELPIYYSADGFRTELPEHIYQLVQGTAEVLCGIRDRESGAVYFPSIQSQIGRRTPIIMVAFPGDTGTPMMYFLSEAETNHIEGSKYEIMHAIDWERSVDDKTFDVWAHQSINRTVLRRLQEIQREIEIAAHFNASYLTESEFEASLLGHPAERCDDRFAQSAVNFLEANLRYLRFDSPHQVAMIRRQNPKLFRRFQESLLDVCGQLNTVEADFEFKAQQLFRKEIAPQIEEIEKTLSKAIRATVGTGLTTVLPIGLALFRPEMSVIAALGLWLPVVVGSAFQTFGDYMNARKGPAYIWSKLSSREETPQ